ncbi:MAG: DUF1919 domain-containing protein [Erysipelotrichaceae bacterium]|nr:DUF1919 domain-containing protein [Erysipelotrichaceae bacterium]
MGGVILHELGLRFDTPTVNLWFESEDYIKFLEHMSDYLQYELVEIQTDCSYPVGLLKDIKIYFQHYTNLQQAKAKWEERIKRIHWDNLYIMMVQRAGCNDNIVARFNDLPYKHKVIFTAESYPDCQSAFCIADSKEETGKVMDLCRYKSEFIGRRWLDEYDYVSF